MRNESNAQGREGSPGFRPGSVSRIAHPRRIEEVTLPSARGAHPGSSRGPRLGGFTIHGGGRSTRSPALARPFAFQTTPAP